MNARTPIDLTNELDDEQCYNKVLPALLALPKDRLRPVNLDVTSAVATVRGCYDVLLGLRAEIVPDGPTLRGWYLTPKTPRRHLVYLYGANMSVVQEYAKLHWLAQTYDMDILVMDYPGYGFSDGTPTVDGLARASVRFFDWMAVRWPEAETPIFVYGHSMGTGFALYVGINRARSAVILEAPFASVPDLVAAKKRHLSWYQRPFVSIKIDPVLTRWAQPIDMIPGLAGPLLIIHGTEDYAVPLEHGKRLFEAAATPNKHFCALQGRGHFAVQPSRDEPTDLSCLQSFLAQLDNKKQAAVTR